MSQRFQSNTTPSISLKYAHRIAGLFDLPEPMKISDYPGKGNVHRFTYLVEAGLPGNRSEHLLQMLNTDVFADPDAVMETMIACIQAQEEALSEGALRANEEWEPPRLIPTKEGMLYLKTDDRGRALYWRLMSRIRGVRSFKNLGMVPDSGQRLKIAEETGRGLALFRVLTAGMNPADVPLPLPGYRDTALYFDQLDSILEGNRTFEQAALRMPSDPLLRKSTGPFFLVHLDAEEFRRRLQDREVRKLASLALDQRSFCLNLQKKLVSGALQKGIVHGDTKLENFLFDTRTNRVKSLVDLDTVMPHTWLSDWGDMARSLVNISGEGERKPDETEIDMDVFKALARGFIRSAPLPPRHEMELMVDAARIMALELGVRFLSDYLRGDTYFGTGNRDLEALNRNRAAVQFSVFQRLSERASAARRSIVELYEERRISPTGSVSR